MVQKKIIIVEDEALIALDLEMIMESMDFDVVGISDNGADALDLIVSRSPDLMLLDINIKGQIDGIELAEIVRTKTKKPFVFITSYADKETLERAKHTLPYGYILKPFSEIDLKATIEIAMFRHANETGRAIPALAIVNSRIDGGLTEKEYQVLLDIYDGLANQQIASKHFVSVNTVKTHLKNIYDKVDVHSRPELVRWVATVV